MRIKIIFRKTVPNWSDLDVYIGEELGHKPDEVYITFAITYRISKRPNYFQGINFTHHRRVKPFIISKVYL